MKKKILIFLLIIVAFFIFRLIYFTASDYINYNKCKESKYVACNDVILEFSGYKINKLKNL
jgi:hypothetical protein